MGRRQMMKTVGIAAGAAAAGSIGTRPTLAQDDDDGSWWGDAWGASMSPSVGIVGRVVSFFGGDTNEAQLAALRQAAYNLAESKKKEIETAITLNENINLMINEWAYTEGKLAAVEAIKQDKTESEIKTEAKQRADEEIAIVEENVLNAGNSVMTTLRNLIQQAQEAEGIVMSDVFTNHKSESLDEMIVHDPITRTLSDGRTVDEERLALNYDGTSTTTGFTPVIYDSANDPHKNRLGDTYGEPMVIAPGGGDTQEFAPAYTFDSETTIIGDTWDKVQTSRDNVRANLDTWVGNVVDEIQAGGLEPGDLLTPDEIVKTITDEEPRARAIADLRALNIAIDWDHGAEVYLETDDVTLFGAAIGVSDPSVVDSLNEGTTYNPADYGTSFYFNYDVTQAVADWSNNYDASKKIDGGLLHLTDLPGPSLEKWLGEDMDIVVQTSYNETAVFKPGDTTEIEKDGRTYYEIDIGDQLDDAIADVATMEVYVAETQDNFYINRIPDQPFTIEAIEGAASLSLDRERDLQTDDNYTT